MFLKGELTLPQDMEDGTKRWLETLIAMPETDEEIDFTEDKFVAS